LNPEFESLNTMSEGKGIKEKDLTKLSREPDVKKMLEEEVFRLTERFTNYSQPKKVIIAGEEWTIDGGELTPKLSLRANIVEEKYADEIEANYNEDEEQVS